MQDTLPAVKALSKPAIPLRPPLINRKTLWAAAFLAGLLWAALGTGLLRGDIFNPGGWPSIVRFLRSALKPDLSPGFLLLTLNAALVTLAFAVCGAALSLVLGFFGGILASETWWEAVFPTRSPAGQKAALRLPWLVVRSALALFRSIHEIIWGLLFVNVLGLDPFSAILAITIPYAAIVAKVFSEILDEAPRSPFDALVNSGVSPAKAFAYALLPAALPDLVSYSFYRFECAIRSSAVLGIIGAGGLGLEIYLSLQSLKFPQIWTLLYALFALNGLTDLWSSLVRRSIRTTQPVTAAGLSPEGLTSARGRSYLPARPSRVRSSLVFGILLIFFSFFYISPSLSRLFSPRALEHLSSLAHAAFPPRWNQIPLGEWLSLSGISMGMALLAVAGAGVISLAVAIPAAGGFLFPGGILAAESTPGQRPSREIQAWRFIGSALTLTARGLLLVARSIPAPIWALILLFVLFPGILPGAAALGLYNLGVLGRLTAEVLENLDPRPLNALKAQGASRGGVFAYAVLPMSFPRFLSYLFYRWEEAIRGTVVLGLVGAGGLGRLLSEQLSSFDYPGLVSTLVIFVAITFLVDLVSARARQAFR